ncbi:thiolase-like protein [Aspergillus multicolor]|uniref:thiolase-like protein n=1 Tax=Aspergillus multicolor TaxID=41759 RepID=UPI003CCD894A
MGIGTAYCGVPNRISYHPDPNGPNVAVDTACASSLVAVHNGVSAILSGESEIFISAGAIAADGQCRSFDDGANGYGRGEGAGAVVLKNHAQVLRDGDHIAAIIQGSAVAHDGKTNGIMAPNADAQTLVAKSALRVANLNASAIEYVEAQATSTPLGDPTEVSAMSAVYGVDHDTPCYIGSIKPHIGHLEAGAGVMGLIKAVLAVRKGVLPPQANPKTLNTRVDWKESGLEVIQMKKVWPELNAPRRAAVCSYGYGGTVSHAKKRLPMVAESLAIWFKSNGTDDNLASICTALATRCDHHEFRTSVVVNNVQEALDALDSVQKEGTTRWMATDRCLPATVSREVVWVFSGHGAQWTEMGKELLDNRDFYAAIEPLDEVVQRKMGASPIEWLRDNAQELDAVYAGISEHDKAIADCCLEKAKNGDYAGAITSWIFDRKKYVSGEHLRLLSEG